MEYKYTPKLFEPKKPFKLSRSKIELFIECPRCFYLDRRLGISRPSLPGFTLNIAVDALLKKEFDTHRTNQTTHPLMKAYGIKAVPFAHKEIDRWRNNFVGINYYDEKSMFDVFGAIDDVWVDEKTGELIIVDYKATSTSAQITLDTEYRQAYKRQMEIYQWLFRQNNFNVSDISYFVYANGKKDKKAFDGKLEFDVELIAYKGDSSWIPEKLIETRKCLEKTKPPSPNKKCEYCQYVEKSNDILN